MRRGEKLFEIRQSPVHGFGGFALRWIPAGTRIVEYVGDRLTEAEVNARYGDGEPEDGRTFLFHVGNDDYIDASHHGNDSRFINHSCDPNCESDVVDGHVYIAAIRDIAPGEELNYDYSLEVEDDDSSPDDATLYVCRCGSPRCRGTMLEPPSEPGQGS